MEETYYAQFAFKEKRKWQIALRRYVLEQKPSSHYAIYFGLDIKTFREWIEAQFKDGLSWENFSTHWQFDHIIPAAYFDLRKEEDLRLCWNFTNIRVEPSDSGIDKSITLDLLAAKAYYESLQKETNYLVCAQMIDKINTLERSQVSHNLALPSFISNKKQYLEVIQTFTPAAFERLNEGIPLEEVLAELALLERFGR